MDGESALLLLVALGAAAAGAVGAALLLRRGGAAGGLAPGLAALQAEVRGVGERVLALERVQGRVQEGVAALGAGLAASGAVARGLAESAAAMRRDLARAAEGVAALEGHALARQDVERRTAESIRRLEAVIAGTQTRGAAGENVLEALVARLPVEWQVRNFRVGDKTVEFALRLPDNRVLPVDSKWSATTLLEQLAACEDPAEQQRLKAQVEATVLARAREVRKYLDPSVTVGFGVAVIPDGVFDLCVGIHAEAFRDRVVLVSYSLFLPYLLLVFQMALRASRQVDLDRVAGYVESVERNLAGLQAELDGRLAKAITMLQNSRDQMSVHAGKASSGLAAVRSGTGGPAPEAPALEAGAGEGED